MKTDGLKNKLGKGDAAGSMRHASGFTLVEVMIVVAIIGVMSALAVVGVNGYMTRHALQHAANELYGDIQLARMRAAKNNQRCRIVFNVPAVNQYTIQDIDNNGVYLRDFKIGDLGRFRNRINFCPSPRGADPAPYDTLEFLAQGILNQGIVAPANSNSVYLTNQNNSVTFRVLVSAAGGTSLDRWNTNTNQWR